MTARRHIPNGRPAAAVARAALREARFFDRAAMSAVDVGYSPVDAQDAVRRVAVSCADAQMYRVKALEALIRWALVPAGKRAAHVCPWQTTSELRDRRWR